MKKPNPKISTLQLILLSTGGMIGSGWLFSPYYGFQAAGSWVLVSWLITALITFIIGLTLAEVGSLLPVVGGIARFIGVTHNRTTSFVFLTLGWLSYVVYLPLEAESAVQYLSFWFHSLVIQQEANVSLSIYGRLFTIFIILGLTWFNTLFITRIATANAFISIWKILIPLLIALGFILFYGKVAYIKANLPHLNLLSGEHILLAVTSSGLAFAFTGFQNGLILANFATNQKKAIPYSLFLPILIGLILYSLLSLSFITCTASNQPSIQTAIAPLLGLVAIFGINLAYTILFIDAILAPLGTANVYTTVTSRILYGLGKDFLPNSFLTKLNRFYAPTYCLWVNAGLGICFLFPFPTWKELVDFLSSIVVFVYIAGPTTLLVLRKECANLPRTFSLKCYNLFGYLGFICCSFLIYWSGLYNLLWLSGFLIITVVFYSVIAKKASMLDIIEDNWVMVFYILSMTLVSHLHKVGMVKFPLDNGLIIIIAIIYCKLFIDYRLDSQAINHNMAKINQEVNASE